MGDGTRFPDGRPVFRRFRPVRSGSRCSFLETPNVLDCRTLRTLEHGLVEAEWAGGVILIPDEGAAFSCFTVGPGEIEIGVEPLEGPPINRFMGVVEEVKNGDYAALIRLDVNGATVCVETSPEKWKRLGLSPGDKVHGFIRLRALGTC